MKTVFDSSLFRLFTSVQLALFLLFLLAATSIVGTLIPQNYQPTFYIEKYGAKAAEFFFLLDIPNMYNSWWFLALLALFAINLIACSVHRLPKVLAIIQKNGLDTEEAQIRKMPLRAEQQWPSSANKTASHIAGQWQKRGWPAKIAKKSGYTIIFAQKGAWTRLGVYIVHCSILVILLGALLGSPQLARQLLKNPLFAFKGSIMIVEGESINYVLDRQDRLRLDLGFSLRCDRFNIEYYDNGMPKLYRSEVTIEEQGQPALSRAIEVNEPLTHNGITFYQSNYKPITFYNPQTEEHHPIYAITLSKKGTVEKRREDVRHGEQTYWPEQSVSYGILGREHQGDVTRRVKLWFSDGKGAPDIVWLASGEEYHLQRPEASYTITVRPLYATGLQATKDPGVWLVYLGCLLMLIGLAMAFFCSHRRIYALVKPGENTGSTVFFAGDANKNKTGFTKTFQALQEAIKTHN